MKWFKLLSSDSTYGALLILLSAIIVERLLFNSGIIMNADFGDPWTVERKIQFLMYLYRDFGSVSNVESVDRAIFTLPLALLSEFIGLGVSQLDGIQLLVIFSLSGISTYSLSRRIVGGEVTGRVCSFLIAVSYMLVSFAIKSVAAYYYLLAYAALPALLLLAERLLKERNTNYRLILLFALLLTWAFSAPQFVVYYAILLALMLLTRIATKSFVNLKAILLSVGVVALLNVVWIGTAVADLLTNSSISPGYPTSLGAILSDYKTFSVNSVVLKVISGYNQWQDQSYNHIQVFQAPLVAGFLFPLVGIIGLVVLALRKRALAPLAYFTVVLDLSLGSNLPWNQWFVRGLDSLPILDSVVWVFRVPERISLLLPVAYVVGCSFVAKELIQSKHGLNGRRKNIAIALLFLIIGASVMANTANETVNKFDFYYSPLKVPSTYAYLNTWLANNTGEHRALYMAPYYCGNNSMHYGISFSWNPDRVGDQEIEYSSSVPSIGWYGMTVQFWGSNLYDLIGEGQPVIPSDIGDKYLAPLGVKYLVYHNDIVGAQACGDEQIASLKRSDLHLVKTIDSSIFVFEVPNPSPLVSVLNGSAQIMSVSHPNPTVYYVKVNASGRYSLLLPLPFEKAWVAETQGQAISPKPYWIGLNSYEMKGAGVQNVTITYSLQNIYSDGLYISASSYSVSLALLGGLIFEPIIRRKRGSRQRRQSILSIEL